MSNNKKELVDKFNEVFCLNDEYKHALYELQTKQKELDTIEERSNAVNDEITHLNELMQNYLNSIDDVNDAISNKEAYQEQIDSKTEAKNEASVKKENAEKAIQDCQQLIDDEKEKVSEAQQEVDESKSALEDAIVDKNNSADDLVNAIAARDAHILYGGEGTDLVDPSEPSGLSFDEVVDDAEEALMNTCASVESTEELVIQANQNLVQAEEQLAIVTEQTDIPTKETTVEEATEEFNMADTELKESEEALETACTLVDEAVKSQNNQFIDLNQKLGCCASNMEQIMELFNEKIEELEKKKQDIINSEDECKEAIGTDENPGPFTQAVIDAKKALEDCMNILVCAFGDGNNSEVMNCINYLKVRIDNLTNTLNKPEYNYV